ncbi:protein crumbs-like, partial [Rhipicephalus sanguineus]|uniref:protein crumbs-like n=1 Tax=Rhipicephalus sanguineus TaxID=34632 RepID=UPI0020C25CED
MEVVVEGQTITEEEYLSGSWTTLEAQRWCARQQPRADTDRKQTGSATADSEHRTASSSTILKYSKHNNNSKNSTGTKGTTVVIGQQQGGDQENTTRITSATQPNSQSTGYRDAVRGTPLTEASQARQENATVLQQAPSGSREHSSSRGRAAAHGHYTSHGHGTSQGQGTTRSDPGGEVSEMLLQDAEEFTTDALAEEDGPRPDAKLITLLENQQTLQAEWLKRKHDRQLKLALAQAETEVQKYSQELRSAQWMQLCNRLNGQLGSKNPWFLFRHLLDPDNSKGATAKKVSQLLRMHPASDQEIIQELTSRYFNTETDDLAYAEYSGEANENIDADITEAENLPKELDKISLIRHAIYADDVTIWTRQGNAEAVRGALQEAANTVQAYVDGNGLKCSSAKSELFIAGKTTPAVRSALQIIVNREVVPQVQTIRVLGLFLEEKNSCKETLKRLESTSRQVTGLLRRITGRKFGLKEKEACLTLVLLWDLACGASQVFLNGSTRLLLNDSQPMLSTITSLTFRTCSNGTILRQSFGNDSISVAVLSNGPLELSWFVNGLKDSVVVGANVTDNQLHWVSIRPMYGLVWLHVGEHEPVLMASDAIRPYLLSVASQAAVSTVVAPFGFRGCLSGGANLILETAHAVGSPAWGSCPLPDGQHCKDHRRDPCFDYHCQHGGLCVLQQGVPKCNCTARYSGEHCEKDEGPLCDRDPWKKKPCVNGGVCVEDWRGNSTRCLCRGPWSGSACQEPAPDAQCDQPAKGCRNGGSCVTGSAQSRTFCQCPPGYAGIYCEQHVGECQLGLCHHGGVCTEGPVGPLCNCQNTGYRGPLCDEDVDECAEESVCLNGGSCVNQPGSFECVCPPGFGGPHCEQAVGPCKDNSPACTTAPAKRLTGALAATPPSPASVVASTRGATASACLEQHAAEVIANSFRHSGFVSPDNSDASPEATPEDTREPTGNMDDEEVPLGPGGAVCLCLPGYSGDLCELKDDLCVSSPCLNGGTCLGLVNDFVCKCERGWTGKRCDRQHDPCRGANPCLHGTCHTLLGGRFHCQCLPGYSGELCERRNVCTADCINGTSLCHEQGWQCDCQYDGETCGRDAVVSAAPGPCSSRPCANNATCRLSELEPLGFVCACPLGLGA